MSKISSGKKHTQSSFWPNFFILTGLLGIVITSYLIFERQNPQRLKFDYVKADEIKKSSEKANPALLKIESAEIFLPIIPSEIKDNKWDATTKGISYLKTSALPGETGNSILYGHNWASLLGNLKKVKPGEKISVIYSDGSAREFLVEYLAEVKPDDRDILQNSSDSRITLYTCSGFLDSKRLVVVAKLLV